MRTKATLILIGLLSTACSGGGSDGGPSPTNPAPVASIEVLPATVQLDRGGTRQMTAVLKDAGGAVLLGRAVTWSSDDASKVSVSATGVVTALVAGTTNVRAAAEGKTAQAAVAVMEPSGQVRRIALSSVAERLDEGDSVQLTAIAYDAQDRVVEGRGIQWTSSGAWVASVSPDGVVTALRPGIVSVSARIDGAVASSTIAVSASYDFNLVFGRAGVGEFEELHTLDLRDTASFELPMFPPGKRASHPAPSPDGQRIAVVVYTTVWESTIFVADRNGSNATQLTTLHARNEAPVWSPDGARIAFMSRPNGGASAVWVMNADGSSPQNLTSDHAAGSQTSPAWSPRLADGSYRIAYSHANAGWASLWTMRDDGTDKVQVTTDASYYDDEPAWSPDGTSLVFTRSGNNAFGDLYVVPSAGGAGRELVTLPFAQLSPTWSPDGRLVAFASKHGDGSLYQVWTVSPEGTRLAQRTFEPLQHADPAWIMRL